MGLRSMGALATVSQKLVSVDDGSSSMWPFQHGSLREAVFLV